MAPRVLRIRHYIATIVAACTLGGFVLAFEFAFLFQSLEQRSNERQRSAKTLGEVVALRDKVDGWLADTRASLGDSKDLRDIEQRLSRMLVQVEKLGDEPEGSEAAEAFDRLSGRLQDIYRGAKLTVRTRPGSEAFERDRQLIASMLDEPESKALEALVDIQAILNEGLQRMTEELAGRRAELWRTVSVSAASYALLVLVVWRWVISRFLRPLQALTQESHRSLDAETGFRLEPAGPHEVRVLTESLSTLVGNLMGARSHLEEKVKERTAELERANRAKNEFLANMSHEIRTPMTAILGYAGLCLAPDIGEKEKRRYSEIIHANGEHLLSVINDILDVSKIEAGRMTVEPTSCSPFHVVSEVRSLMELRAREKGLLLTVEIRGAVPEVVRTDPTRLRQILLNLVNNAIKFTDQGKVVLRFGMDGEGDAEKLAFEVQDTGVGLTPEQMERVFRPFVQADTSTTRKYGGSGLGLTISQTLARLLGGDLTCNSEPGLGSIFRVTLDPGPLAGVRRLFQIPAGSESEPRQILPADTGAELAGRVLLAEDVAVNRRLVAVMLRRCGLEVEEAENGRIALEKVLEARDSGQPFDVVLMDMQMPEMDGYEVTSRLRQAGYLRPILALTSHSMSGERQRCLAAGCDDFLTKPVDRRVFLPVLARYLPGAGAGEPAVAS